MEWAWHFGNQFGLDRVLVSSNMGLEDPYMNQQIFGSNRFG